MKTYKIAAIPGDGIGTEVVSAGVEVLHALARREGKFQCKVDHFDWGGTWYWSFTALSAQRLFGEIFPAAGLQVETRGNVLAATAFLQGIALEELRKGELDYNDPDYQVIITVRAIKEAA